MSEKPVRKLTSDINCAIHNKFEFEVIDAETKEVKQRAEAYNVICDTFWPVFLNISGVYNNLVVGSGTGTPSVSDTELFNKLASFNTWQVMPDLAYLNNPYGSLGIKFPSPGVIEFKRCIIIQASQLVNSNLSEIGLSNDGTHIITHAMLQDMNGNPLVIQKTEHDIIYIYAYIYVHYDPQGFNGVFVCAPPNETGVSGSAYGSSDHRVYSFFTWLVGFRNGNAHERIWGPKYNGDRNSSENFGGFSLTPNVQNRQLTIPTIRVLQNNGNHPIPFICFASGVESNVGSGAARFSPDLYITKEAFPNSQLLISDEAIATGDGVTNNFNTKFPVKSGLAIYVDGVIKDSGYSVLYGGYPNDPSLNKISIGGTFECYYKGKRIINLNAMNGTGGWCFVPAQSDSFIYKNPDKQYFNSIEYQFGVNNLSDGVTIYVETSEDQNTWTVIDTKIPSNSGNQAYTVNLQTSINPTYIRFRWVVTDPYPSGLYDPGHAVYLNKVYFYNDTYGPYNIHFDTPPAAGAVITADYLPDCIPKDENHVLDVGFTIQFGAYSGSGV